MRGDHTLIARGFIQPEQFYGVDINSKWEAKNTIAHPRAHFFTDDLLHAIRTYDIKPGVVYLDTTKGLTKENLRLLIGTMECCPEGTAARSFFSDHESLRD